MSASYSRGSSEPKLLEETVPVNFARTVERCGEREALVSCDQRLRYTWAELAEAIDALACGLLASGIARGDRVGLWSPNCAEWTLVQYATARVGAILVNVNPAYRSSELQFVLRQSGCRMLIAAPSFKTSDYRALVAEVRSGLAKLERVVFLGEEFVALVESGAGVDRCELRRRSAQLSPHDPINIQYTSGTTGFPKGATLTHHNILNNGYMVGEGVRYTEDDRVCIPVPFYHCFGMVMGSLACSSHGATIVIPGPAFDAAATLQALASERCTSLYGVPTMFIAMLADSRFHSHDLTALRTGIMAGSPCPTEIMRRVIDRMNMHEVAICYGMTETSPVSTQTAVDDPLEKRVGTVGRVGPHLEVQVVATQTGSPVERGEPGELCTRGYSVMSGYWEEPELTREAIDPDGWMHTGDLAIMDEDGYVSIVGRIKDLVIRGGENIYPREIEEFLFTHPDIRDAQVIGVPDERNGEELMAWIIAQDASCLTEQAVRDYCRGRIAHYKIPRYVKLVDEFPMTVTGKVQKFRMREVAMRELDGRPPLSRSPPRTKNERTDQR